MLVVMWLCRSEAWEEWADWLLEQPQEEDAAGASSSGMLRSSSLTSPVSNLLRSCLRQWCSGGDGSSSSSAHVGRHDTAAAGLSSAVAQDGAGSSGQQQQCAGTQGARHALVFCYANDLRWYHTT